MSDELYPGELNTLLPDPLEYGNGPIDQDVLDHVTSRSYSRSASRYFDQAFFSLKDDTEGMHVVFAKYQPYDTNFDLRSHP